jgi:hypothetical protein
VDACFIYGLLVDLPVCVYGGIMFFEMGVGGEWSSYWISDPVKDNNVSTRLEDRTSLESNCNC